MLNLGSLTRAPHSVAEDGACVATQLYDADVRLWSVGRYCELVAWASGPYYEVGWLISW